MEDFKLGIVHNGEVWMQMIKSRNLTSHTYDENTADDIIKLVKNLYYREFENLKITMNSFQKEESNEL